MKFRELLNKTTVVEQTEQTEQTEQLSESVQESLQRIVDAMVIAGHVAQTAHWNLRSRNFISLHPWFGETYAALNCMVDEVAEQIKIANIDSLVNVNWGTTQPATNETDLLLQVQTSLEFVQTTLNTAANDETLSRPLQNLVDGWIANVDKMVWFIKSSK